MITTSQDLSTVWPEVFEAVVSSLQRRGISLHSAEDATQEAGSRVLANGIGFADADDLRRWVQIVAWRVAIDESRHLSRQDGRAEDALEKVSTQEVPSEVEHRLRLAATRRAWRTLSPADREAIVSDLDEAPVRPRKEAVRLAVRRHRARARLLALMEGVAAIAIFGFRRAKRAPVVVVAAAVLPISVVVLPFVQPDAPGDGVPPAGGVAAAGPHAIAPIAQVDRSGGGPTDAAAGAAAGAAAANGAAVDTSGARSQRTPLPDVDTRPATPMDGEDEPGVHTTPKEPGEPVFCMETETPETPRTCSPPLPVTVPAPPNPVSLIPPAP